MHDYTKVWEIMHWQNPEWKQNFDLVVMQIFKAECGHLIGQPSSDIWWD